MTDDPTATLAALLHREACSVGTFRRDDDWHDCYISDHRVDAARLIAAGVLVTTASPVETPRPDGGGE